MLPRDRDGAEDRQREGQQEESQPSNGLQKEWIYLQHVHNTGGDDDFLFSS